MIISDCHEVAIPYQVTMKDGRILWFKATGGFSHMEAVMKSEEFVVFGEHRLRTKDIKQIICSIGLERPRADGEAE